MWGFQEKPTGGEMRVDDCRAVGGGQAWRALGMRLSKPGCGSESPDGA